MTAVVVEGTNSAVKAHIDNEGNLILDFTAGATKLAWIVDTQASPSVAIKTA